MPEILSFEEITISRTFKDGSGRSIEIEPPTLSNPVDAVVICDIEWKGNPMDEKIYLLWTNITENTDANFWGNIQEKTIAALGSVPRTSSFLNLELSQSVHCLECLSSC